MKPRYNDLDVIASAAFPGKWRIRRTDKVLRHLIHLEYVIADPPQRCWWAKDFIREQLFDALGRPR